MSRSEHVFIERRWLSAAAVALVIAIAMIGRAHAAAALDPTQLEKRLGAVAILLEKSSAARQVDASGDARAIERRDKARAIHRQALAAFQAGDYEKASVLLPEASAQMFEAVRYAAPEQVAAPKQQLDFDARLESVRSLAAAHKRISADKPGTPGAAETAGMIDKLIGEAQAQAAAKDLFGARATLDRAYLLAKAAVSALRSGDTLVRSLEFSSSEEEYRYEVDRNDTHEMLIKVLLKDKVQTPGQRSLVGEAQQLRARAEAAARNGDHAGAVKLLEESTRELVRVIRSAGVFIPG